MKWKIGIVAGILLSAFGIAPNALSQWIHASASIGTSINCFVNSGSNLYAGTLNDAAAVWLSTDHGVSWIPKKSKLGNVYGLISLGTDVFATAQFPAGFYRSTDNGDTWSDFNIDLPTQNHVNGFIVGKSQLYSNDSMGLFYSSSDSAKSWTLLNNGSLGKGAYILQPNDTFLFASTDSGLFRSRYNETNWTPIITHLKTYNFTLIGSTIFVYTDIGYRRVFLRSEDNGRVWDTINVPGSFVIASGTDLFTGSEGNTSPVSISKDSGKSWMSIGSPNPHRLTTLIVSGPNLVEGTISGGLWYHPLDGSSEVKIENTFLNLSLSPNPTTGIITVHNAPANILHVTVSSILGESVLELAHPNAPELTLDLSKLPTGIYFVGFSLANGVITRKIIKE